MHGFQVELCVRIKHIHQMLNQSVPIAALRLGEPLLPGGLNASHNGVDLGMEFW